MRIQDVKHRSGPASPRLHSERKFAALEASQPETCFSSCSTPGSGWAPVAGEAGAEPIGSTPLDAGRSIGERWRAS